MKELLDFAAFMKHTREEVKARREWVQTIASSARVLWPSCKIRVFGSFFTGLSLPNGDVDIAVLGVQCSIRNHRSFVKSRFEFVSCISEDDDGTYGRTQEDDDDQ